MDRTAAALHAQGLAKGERLALLSHNCWQFVVLSYATARLGVVLVPVNFMLGADEVAYIVDHSEASAFVAEDALVPVAEEALSVAQGSVRLHAAIAPSGELPPDGWQDVADWAEHDGAAPQVHVADDDPVRLGGTSRRVALGETPAAPSRVPRASCSAAGRCCGST